MRESKQMGWRVARQAVKVATTAGLATSLMTAVLMTACLMAGATAWAGTIHGTVTNRTNGKPSAGDQVQLLSLMGAMDVVGNAKTDAQGRFTLNTPNDTDPFLIKVEHEKSAYFKNMPPGMQTADITVYDVAARVEGVSTEADVIRLETEGGQLKVVENYFVRNSSSPPVTEARDHTLEVVLPPDATLDGAATVGPGSLPISATPDPVGAKGHYAFAYPIRPNEGEQGTRFQLSYHIAYKGSFTFKPEMTTAVDNLVVMMPKSMTFQAGNGANFQNVPDDTTGQTLLLKNVAAKQAVSFTVSGTGALPRDADQAGGQGGGQAGGPAGGPQGGDASAEGPGGRPGGGIGVPIDTPDPLSKYKWWILAGLALALAGAAAFLLRKPAGAVMVVSPGAVTAPAAAKGTLLLEALKEELFAIESEKIAGKLTPQEYASVKAALEIVLKRALTRSK